MSTGCIECEENVFEIVLQPERIDIIAECKQGPIGPPGLPAGVQQTDTDDITPASTEIIASLTLADECAGNFRVLVIDSTNNLKRWLEVDAVHSPTTGAYHTIYATLGDFIDFDIDVVDNGTTLDLELTNNEAVNLDTKVLIHAILI